MAPRLNRILSAGSNLFEFAGQLVILELIYWLFTSAPEETSFWTLAISLSIVECFIVIIYGFELWLWIEYRAEILRIRESRLEDDRSQIEGDIGFYKCTPALNQGQVSRM